MPLPSSLLVFLPASNEADFILPCLRALLAQDAAAGRVVVILAANACRDATVARARSLEADFAAHGWVLRIDDSPVPGKLAALNRAEALAANMGPEMGAEMGADPAVAPRLYLDADVICEPTLLGQIRAALDGPAPAYATGTLVLAPSRSWVTRAYGALWSRLPFVTGGAVGAGCFAVNAAGRARWGAFPDIISDDTFVRQHFTPAERYEVPARYHWPLVEGLGNLIRVRHRQDAGVEELHRLYPDLMVDPKPTPRHAVPLWPLLRAEPLGFAVYALVRFAVLLKGRTATEWTRGR